MKKFLFKTLKILFITSVLTLLLVGFSFVKEGISVDKEFKANNTYYERKTFYVDPSIPFLSKTIKFPTNDGFEDLEVFFLVGVKL